MQQPEQLWFKDNGRIERQSSVLSGISGGTEDEGLGIRDSQELNIIPEEDSQIDANSSHRSKTVSDHD